MKAQQFPPILILVYHKVFKLNLIDKQYLVELLLFNFMYEKIKLSIWESYGTAMPAGLKTIIGFCESWSHITEYIQKGEWW